MFLSIRSFLFLQTLPRDKHLLAAFQMSSKNAYIPAVSRLWPEGPAGQRSIQEPLQGAVDVQDGTVMQLKLRLNLKVKVNIFWITSSLQQVARHPNRFNKNIPRHLSLVVFSCNARSISFSHSTTFVSEIQSEFQRSTVVRFRFPLCSPSTSSYFASFPFTPPLSLHSHYIHVLPLPNRAWRGMTCYRNWWKQLERREDSKLFFPGAKRGGEGQVGRWAQSGVPPPTLIPSGYHLGLAKHSPIMPRICNPTVIYYSLASD